MIVVHILEFSNTDRFNFRFIAAQSYQRSSNHGPHREMTSVFGGCHPIPHLQHVWHDVMTWTSISHAVKVDVGIKLTCPARPSRLDIVKLRIYRTIHKYRQWRHRTNTRHTPTELPHSPNYKFTPAKPCTIIWNASAPPIFHFNNTM